MAGFNDLKVKGKQFSVHSATKLKALVRKYSDMSQTQQGDSALSSAAQEVFDHVGLGSKEILKFISNVAESVDAFLHKLRHNSTVRVKKAVADATAPLSSMVDVDKEETAYRTMMKSTSSKLADRQDALEHEVDGAVAAFELEPDPFNVVEVKLVQQAKELQDQCMFQVCFFAALTLFRDPKLGATTADGKKITKQFEYVMKSLEPLKEAVQFGAGLMKEMEEALKAFCIVELVILRCAYFRMRRCSRFPCSLHSCIFLSLSIF